jgi:hypothetical protein
MNNPKIIRAIWQMYKYNRNEVRWGNHVSKDYFYSTQGTKQGGILSGPIFLQYTNFLNERLMNMPGIKYAGLSWNCLGYADDFILIGQSFCHLQSLLDVCTEYQNEGYVTWNATKSVIISLTKLKFYKPDPISDFKLNNVKLAQKTEAKYLGYIINQNFTDSAMISRQARRLNCLTNAMSRSLPLKLICEGRLKQLVRAYGSVYMLGTLDTYFDYEIRSLIKAHSYFTAVVSQYFHRSPKWDKSKNLFDNTNTSIYGAIDMVKFKDQIPRVKSSFAERYLKYYQEISVK